MNEHLPKPWATYTTPTPEIMTAHWGRGPEARRLFVTAGNNHSGAATGNVDLGERSPVIFQTGHGASLETQAFPVRLTLHRWLGSEPPIIQLHPLALLHLFVTGQAAQLELRQCVSGIGNGCVEFSQPITEPCELLTMLDVRRAVLRFDTTQADGTVLGVRS